MTDRYLFSLRDGSEALIDGIDDRFAVRFPCILTEPTRSAPNTRTLAAHVAREWQACVAWLESAQCQPAEDAMIRMLAAAGKHMQTLTSSLPDPRPITPRHAAKAVYGETDRVPIYGMLLHLAAVDTPTTLITPIRALAAQLLLAQATLIYHDEGTRIDLCREITAARASKPPVPSMVPACRLVRQMTAGQHADLVELLPTTRVVFAQSYEALRARLEDSRAAWRDSLDQICVTLRYARSGAQRRQRVVTTGGASPPAEPEPKATPETPPAPEDQREDEGHSRSGALPGRQAFPRPRKQRAGPEELKTSAVPASAEQEYGRLGLSTAEVRPARTTLRSPDTKSERPGASLSMRIRAQQGMLQDRARINQRLPIHRGVLRRDELEHLVAALRPWMETANGRPTTNNPAEAEAIAMLVMVLATGASPSELHALSVTRNEATIPADHVRALLLDSAKRPNLWVRVPAPVMDPDLYAQVAELLHPVSEGLRLPLPAPLAQLLRSVRLAAGNSGGNTLFAAALSDIEKAATAKLQRINARYRCRLRLTQLSDVLPRVIADRTGNWSYAWIITGDGDPNVHTPLVYQTTPASTLVALHSDAAGCATRTCSPSCRARCGPATSSSAVTRSGSTCTFRGRSPLASISLARTMRSTAGAPTS